MYRSERITWIFIFSVTLSVPFPSSTIHQCLVQFHKVRVPHVQCSIVNNVNIVLFLSSCIHARKLLTIFCSSVGNQQKENTASSLITARKYSRFIIKISFSKRQACAILCRGAYHVTSLRGQQKFMCNLFIDRFMLAVYGCWASQKTLTEKDRLEKKSIFPLHKQR